MPERSGRSRIRLGITILVAAVGLAMVFGATTLAGPSGVGKALAQATSSTTSRGTTTVTTSGTTTTVTTTRASTAITSTGISSQVNTPPPSPSAAPGAPRPSAAPAVPATGTGGLLSEHTPSSISMLWLPLVALLVLAGGLGSYLYTRRH